VNSVCHGFRISFTTRLYMSSLIIKPEISREIIHMIFLRSKLAFLISPQKEWASNCGCLVFSWWEHEQENPWVEVLISMQDATLAIKCSSLRKVDIRVPTGMCQSTQIISSCWTWNDIYWQRCPLLVFNCKLKKIGGAAPGLQSKQHFNGITPEP